MRTNSNHKTPAILRFYAVFAFVAVLLLSPILMPIGLLFFINYRFKLNRIARMARAHWGPQNKFMLLVYSNSPNWKDYIEKTIIPKVEPHAEILNFSERTKWGELEDQTGVELFLAFSGVEKIKSRGKIEWGGREYNPVVIVLLPNIRPKVIRFWKAFKDHKHGKDQKLRILEQELSGYLKKTKEAEGNIGDPKLR